MKPYIIHRNSGIPAALLQKERVVQCGPRSVLLKGGPLNGLIVRVPLNAEVYSHRLKDGSIHEYELSRPPVGGYLGEKGGLK